MTETTGKSLCCDAAVLREFNKPLSIEKVVVDPPKAREVRVRVLYSALCHTDMHTACGADAFGAEETILGHECAGEVESVGPEVTTVAPGDSVIMLWLPECGECKLCRSGKTNLCGTINDTQANGVMPDGTVRFHGAEDGKPLKHFMGCSGFSQYAVVADISIVKIGKGVPLSKACLLGCSVTTGFGAAQVSANVQKGDRVAIWGAGAVGLSIVQGSSMRDTSQIIVIDLDNGKEQLAREFGATDFVNPKHIDGSLVQHLKELSDGGVDFAFEAIGNLATMRQALDSVHKGWGQVIVISVVPKGQELSTPPFELLMGLVVKGCAFGGVKSRSQLPELVSQYMEGKLVVDKYITHRRSLNDINKGWDDMKSGACLRCLIDMWPEDTSKHI